MLLFVTRCYDVTLLPFACCYCVVANTLRTFVVVVAVDLLLATLRCLFTRYVVCRVVDRCRCSRCTTFTHVAAFCVYVVVVRCCTLLLRCRCCCFAFTPLTVASLPLHVYALFDVACRCRVALLLRLRCLFYITCRLPFDFCVLRLFRCCCYRCGYVTLFPLRSIATFARYVPCTLLRSLLRC